MYYFIVFKYFFLKYDSPLDVAWMGTSDCELSVVNADTKSSSNCMLSIDSVGILQEVRPHNAYEPNMAS